VTKEQTKQQYLKDDNLRRLTRQIVESRNAAQILEALPVVIPHKGEGRREMPNNEKFNQMLNSCKNPRMVYNVLMCIAEEAQTIRKGGRRCLNSFFR